MSNTIHKFFDDYIDGSNNLGNRNKYKEGSRNYQTYQEGYDKGYAEYQDRRAQKLDEVKLLIEKHPCLYEFIEYAKKHQIDFLANNITVNDHYIHEHEIQAIYDFWDEL